MSSILIVSNDVVSTRMAGMGIRYWELAHVLARVAKVTLSAPSDGSLQPDGFDLVTTSDDLERLASRHDCVLVQGETLARLPGLREHVLIVDLLYGSYLLENLAWHASDRERGEAVWQRGHAVLLEQLRYGDFFICGSERQRDYWLGALAAIGRLNPLTYAGDPDGRHLVDVVPFGLPSHPPRAIPDGGRAGRRDSWTAVRTDGDISETGTADGRLMTDDGRSTRDDGQPTSRSPALSLSHSPAVPPSGRTRGGVVVWGGGLYEWLDPLTPIRAVARLAPEWPELRLVFPGVAHPNPDVPAMPVVARTIELARELNLLDRHVFFGDGWVDYEGRVRYLLEADVGVSAAPAHLETHFAFRTRLLDYIWTGLPMVVTAGDPLADLVRERELGRVVPAGDDAAFAAALAELLPRARPRSDWEPHFAPVREQLTWERAAAPLVRFLTAPDHAADRRGTQHAGAGRATHESTTELEALASTSEPSLAGTLPHDAAGSADPTTASAASQPLATGGAASIQSASALPTVGVVLLSWNGGERPLRCLESVLAQSRPPDEVLVVDNASSDGSPALILDLLRRRFRSDLELVGATTATLSDATAPATPAQPSAFRPPPSILRPLSSVMRVTFIQNERNLGFGGGMNVGLAGASTDVVVLLNQDVVLEPGCLEALAAAFAREPRAAVVGVKLLEPDGRTIQHAGGYLTHPLALAGHLGHGEVDRGQHDAPREVEYVTGAVVGLRRSAVSRLGGFDEGFFPAYFEEADLCRRVARAGRLVIYEPRAVARHEEATSTGKNSERYYHFYHRGRLRFLLKHVSARCILEEVLPAELHRLEHPMAVAERVALAAAYRDSLITWPFGESVAAQESPQAVESVADALTQLRAESFRRAPTPDRLAETAHLAEHVFHSKVPVVGRIVAGTRDLWNSVSTKWYVRPLLSQQSAFNAQVAARFAELDQRLVALDRELAELTRQLGQHRLESGALHRRFEALEASAAPVALSPPNSNATPTTDPTVEHQRAHRSELRTE
ncbi:MAG: glycosyltransferase [Chloroflexi bacterium]|nr:glycosyltransferase [Chloroflexota bacterium]